MLIDIVWAAFCWKGSIVGETAKIYGLKSKKKNINQRAKRELLFKELIELPSHPFKQIPILFTVHFSSNQILVATSIRDISILNPLSLTSVLFSTAFIRLFSLTPTNSFPFFMDHFQRMHFIDGQRDGHGEPASG